MKIRLPLDLWERLEKAHKITGHSKTTIARKACLKYKNKFGKKYVAIKKIQISATYGGKEMGLDISEGLLNGMDADKLRKVITWYLDLYEIKNVPLYKTDGDMKSKEQYHAKMR